MTTVAVVGEVIVDKVINGDSTTTVLGGSAANTALAIVRCGSRADLRARFGSDEAGQFLKSQCIEFGIDVSNAVDAPEPATVVEATIDTAGVPQYKFFMDGTADWQWTSQEISKPLSTDTKAIVVGSYASIVDSAFKVQFDWVQRQRAKGVLFFYDPNVRPTAINQKNFADEARERINQWVRIADVVKVSDEDLQWLDPTMSPQESAAQWSTIGPKYVVLTAGPEGATVYQHGQCVGQVSAPKVTVVDTVGAGDTFMAWLVCGFAELSPADRAHPEGILRIVRTATIASAATCTRAGCNPPTQAEITALLPETP